MRNELAPHIKEEVATAYRRARHRTSSRRTSTISAHIAPQETTVAVGDMGERSVERNGRGQTEAVSFPVLHLHPPARISEDAQRARTAFRRGGGNRISTAQRVERNERGLPEAVSSPVLHLDPLACISEDAPRARTAYRRGGWRIV